MVSVLKESITKQVIAAALTLELFGAFSQVSLKILIITKSLHSNSSPESNSHVWYFEISHRFLRNIDYKFIVAVTHENTYIIYVLVIFHLCWVHGI